MEAAIILGLLGYGAHQYLDHSEPDVVKYNYSTQTAQEIYIEPSLTPIDFSKPGNFVVGDSPETGVQWIVVTN